MFALSAGCGELTPKQARERGVAFKVLNEKEGRALEALGDTLLPGAAAAGITHYVDHQLASATPLLILKYMDYPASFLDFYKQGLAALDRLAHARYGRVFSEISAAQRTDLVREISQNVPAEWSGPPAPLFYFVTRNDAVDVFYGTQEGFAKLDIPYMPHIAPKEPW